ncbi:MAG: right-handed parallel beta-helix repeat-containing protein [Clostridia bacterium]|nr:right-handed parallel beta-helix repeat-containing protein [Clostridia bacterium]
MAFDNGAVDFAYVRQKSQIRDFDRNIPFSDYLYEEKLPERYVSITDFGAGEKESYTVNTRAVNSAISAVSANGGGTVLVPEGTYICSRVELKSNVTLFVKGTLKCIDYETNRNAAESLAFGEIHDVASRARYGFIYSDKADNITICGGGRIDGSGATYCKNAKCPETLLPFEKFHLKSYIMNFRARIRFEKENSGRVNLIELRDGKNIDIHNIELYETACWTCNLFECENIKIKDVIINSNYHVANSDGFDLSCCSNAEIKHCYVATGDDGICIKADGDKNIENILVENCKVMSLANCFKIGTTVYRDVKNVTVRDCEFFMNGTTGGYSGISIQSDCGGNVSDITVENVKMKGITSAFLLWLANRRNIKPGSLKNITLRNIIAEDVSLPSAITGTVHNGEVYEVQNAVFENINIKYRESDEEIYIREGGVGYEAMLEYPEITRLCSIYTNSHEESPYWELPVYGLFIRDAHAVTLKNFTCIPRQCNKRPCFNFEMEGNENISIS